MAFSKLGAAITLDVQEEVINWLCDANRPIEVQDFTSPNLLNSDFSDLVLKYKDKLKSHTGTKGLHGPFFGLDLGNQEIEFQKLISKRLLTALDICEKLSSEYMVIHSPFDEWMNLNKRQYPHVQSSTISAMGDILEVPLKRASEIGCTLVLENCDDTDPNMRLIAIQDINHPNLKLSIDTGHAHLSHSNYKAPSVVDFISAAEGHLAHVHLQDVDGYADRHWLPGEGSITWPAVVDALKICSTKPHLIIEVGKNTHRIANAINYLESVFQIYKIRYFSIKKKFLNIKIEMLKRKFRYI